MTTGLTEALRFLLETFFSLLALVFILRLILYAVRADFYNPLSQFVYQVTNPVISPLRRVIPTFGVVELATVLMIVVVYIPVVLLRGAGAAGIGAVLLSAVVEALRAGVGFLMIALIVHVLLSWVPSAAGHPMARILDQICHPILRPVRAVLPAVAGLDLSPLIAIVLLQAVMIMLAYVR